MESANKVKKLVLWVEIHNLSIRIFQLQGFIELQKMTLEMLGHPYFPGISDFIKYGYQLQWDHEFPELFLKQLESIAEAEKKYDDLKKLKEREYSLLK